MLQPTQCQLLLNGNHVRNCALNGQAIRQFEERTCRTFYLLCYESAIKRATLRTNPCTGFIGVHLRYLMMMGIRELIKYDPNVGKRVCELLTGPVRHGKPNDVTDSGSGSNSVMGVSSCVLPCTQEDRCGIFNLHLPRGFVVPEGGQLEPKRLGAPHSSRVVVPEGGQLGPKTSVSKLPIRGSRAV